MGSQPLHCMQQKHFPLCIAIFYLATSSWVYVNSQQQILSLGVKSSDSEASSFPTLSQNAGKSHNLPPHASC